MGLPPRPLGESPLTAYWARTLPLFNGRPVRIVLQDGRERVGALSVGADGRFRVWTDQGPATIPLGEVRSVEAA